MLPWRLCLLVILSTGCAGMKRQALESAMEAIWEEGDLDRIDAAYEPELGHEVRRFVEENRTLYPDLELTLDDVIIHGNRYVTLWTVSGTHRDLGRRVELSGVSVRTRVEGKIVEETMYYDAKSIYDQLGFRVVPPEGLSPFGVTPMVSRGDANAPEAEEAPEAEDEPEADEADEAPEGEDEPEADEP